MHGQTDAWRDGHGDSKLCHEVHKKDRYLEREAMCNVFEVPLQCGQKPHIILGFHIVLVQI